MTDNITGARSAQNDLYINGLAEERRRTKSFFICGIGRRIRKSLDKFTKNIQLFFLNGDHFNNDFDILQILCPNCHSIQEGNAGANAGKYVKMGE